MGTAAAQWTAITRTRLIPRTHIFRTCYATVLLAQRVRLVGLLAMRTRTLVHCGARGCSVIAYRQAAEHVGVRIVYHSLAGAAAAVHEFYM